MRTTPLEAFRFEALSHQGFRPDAFSLQRFDV
jgi:hypothetical protein